MTCQQAQSSLSLYLYGELDFAQEEALENHLAQCAFCQLSFAREKEWHTAANAQAQEPPLDLLAECRQQLRPALVRESTNKSAAPHWWRWPNPFQISATRWSSQIALASMLVFAGFGLARWLDYHQTGSGPLQMGFFNPSAAHIRDVQAGDSGLVRIVVDQESEITGRLDDPNVRRLLLTGTRQADPSVRFYSFEILNGQGDVGTQVSQDLRDALFDSVRNDPNPAVRLEAIEGLRRFASDPATLDALKFVVEHDDNPGVRSQAINILVPTDGQLTITPAAAQALEDVMRATPQDDYVRARCSQGLREAKLPVVY